MTSHNQKELNDDCVCDIVDILETNGVPVSNNPHAVWCPLSPEYREPPAPKNKHKAPKMKNNRALANDMQSFLNVMHPGARLGGISISNNP